MTKTISIERLYCSITPYLFIFLMGGFIAYHIAVGYGLIPAFLGGYFGIASAVVAAIYALRFPNVLKLNIQYSPVATFVHLAIFSIALVTTIVSSLYNDIPSDAVTQSYSTLVLWIALFLLGFHLLRSNIEKTVKLSYIFYFLFLGFIAIYAVTTKSLSLDLNIISDSDLDGLAGYQSLARNLLIITVLLICYSKKNTLTLFTIISSCFAFFYLGARSEFVGFIFFILLFMLIKTRHQKKTLLMVIALILGVVFLYYTFQEAILSSRQIQLLNIQESSSWLAREQLERENIQFIVNHPILGSFGGHATLTGGVGGYSHNSLSAYVNYGVFFFLGYIGLSVYATFSSLLEVLRKSTTSYWWYSLSINAICLLLMLSSKPVFWAIPFFGWGLYFSAKTLHNAKQPYCNSRVVDTQ